MVSSHEGLTMLWDNWNNFVWWATDNHPYYVGIILTFIVLAGGGRVFDNNVKFRLQHPGWYVLLSWGYIVTCAFLLCMTVIFHLENIPTPDEQRDFTAFKTGVKQADADYRKAEDAAQAVWETKIKSIEIKYNRRAADARD
jgi:hypothetical protein